ncbi:hypothetical protein FB451DRAFT_1290566 [Mycena latifolia]|nr:hypothetical protein FB451DRAFT_1290566 [Mycena latifolia]
MPPPAYSFIRLRAAKVRPCRARPSAPPPHRCTYSHVRPCIAVKSHRVGADSPSCRLPHTPSSARALEPARCVLHTRLTLRSSPDKTSRAQEYLVLIGGSTSPRNLEWPSKFESAQACPERSRARSIRRPRSARRLRGARLKWTKCPSSQECEKMSFEALVHRGRAIRAELPHTRARCHGPRPVGGP